MRDCLGGVLCSEFPRKKHPRQKNPFLAANEAVSPLGMSGEGAANAIVGLFLQSGFAWNKLGKSQGTPKYPQQLGMTGNIRVTKGVLVRPQL